MECENDIINPDFNSYNNEGTNYDEVRSPHKQLVNSGGIKMPVLVKKLGPSLTCPICLDLLRNTSVTECLHRFCADCIKNSIYKTNRQCPTCRRKIVSKRNLRSDPNIDLLIDTIWPDRNIYEKIHNILMESTCESPTKIRDLNVENDDNIDDFSSSENDFPSNDEKEEYDFSSSDDDELNDFDKSSSFNSSSDFENENNFVKNKRQKFEEEENIPKNKNIKENIKLLPEMDIYLKEYVKNTLPLGNVTIYLKPLLINSQQYYRVHLPHLATGKFILNQGDPFQTTKIGRSHSKMWQK
ncbi:unnamed protein product [Meloidogyne enterolobii]|uniref:Uncharacterized protein n=1 Tax=Meloidogyne enterolobii TaxID=390850 RepID=A0ACB0XXD5_MELEN